MHVMGDERNQKERPNPCHTAVCRQEAPQDPTVEGNASTKQVAAVFSRSGK